MVRRWYRKAGAIWAKAQPLLLYNDGEHLAVDEREGSSIEVPLTSFRMTVEDLIHDTELPEASPRTRRPSIPSPTKVVGK